MSARLVGYFLAVLALGLVGCKAHEGQKVIGYNGGGSNNWTKAPDDGRYALRGASGQNVTYFVQKGERIGFRKNPDGAVVAIAGDNAPVELERGTAKQAYWKYDKKEGK